MQDYSMEVGSGLSITNLYENVNGSMLSGKGFDGPVANYINIDTSATTVMVSNHYVNKSSLTVRTGGRSTDVSGAADRMYSFYFQNFTYNTPMNSILDLRQPVQRVQRNNHKEISFSTYPNPVINHLNINVPSSLNKQDINASVYDLNGRMVKQLLNHSNNRIELGELKSGIYVLQVKAGDQSYVQRIVKL